MHKRVARRLTAAAAAAALQAGFYWLILHARLETNAPSHSSPLEVTLFSMAGGRERPPLPASAQRRAPSHESEPEPHKRTARAKAANPVDLPPASRTAGSAPPDWRRAIEREVRAEQSPPPSARQLDFGFPARPAAAASPPAFGWDPAVIHRVEPLATGGILINLGDHCALVIYGFMLLPGCRIGSIPANGHLFDHAHDLGDRRLGGLP